MAESSTRESKKRSPGRGCYSKVFARRMRLFERLMTVLKMFCDLITALLQELRYVFTVSYIVTIQRR